MSTATQRSTTPTRSALGSILGRSSAGIMLALLLFTALIWLRLRLVTDVPRQAYAEPKPQGQAERETDRTRESSDAKTTTANSGDR